MKFSLDGKEFELRGIIGKPRKLISSHDMTKLLKKGHQGVFAQLCSVKVHTSKYYIFPYLQKVIDKNSKVFEDIPKGLPPPRDHDHAIHLILGVFLLTLDLIHTCMARRVKLSLWLKKCWQLA